MTSGRATAVNATAGLDTRSVAQPPAAALAMLQALQHLCETLATA